MISNIKRHKELLLLSAILLLATFLRFYRLDEYMQFLGDQGRDSLIVKQILIDHHLPAIGPPSSVGSVYLGPFFYYLMAISMTILWLNPVAAAGMVALIGVLTVALLYYLTYKWFSQIAALVAAFLYSISPVAINYSKFAWNPNPVPFFTLLAFLGIYQAHKTGNFFWFLLTGGSLAAVLQLHYLTLILLPVFGLLWLNELRIHIKEKSARKNFWLGTAMSLVVFLLIMSPLAFFDIRHNYMNLHGLIDIFGGKNGEVNLSLALSFFRLPEVFVTSFIGRYLAIQNILLGGIVALLIFVPIVRGFYFYSKTKQLSWVILTLTIWLVVGFLGLMFYQGPIYDHYLGFLSPIPFILLGGFCQLVLELKVNEIIKIIMVIIIIAVITIINIINNPLLQPPNHQLQRTQQIASFIINQAANQPFNFALLSENNYDAAYQFYLEQYSHQPKKVPAEKTNQLFVVCEDPICQPVGHSKYEIAAFGWTQIEWEKQVEGTRIFKLTPNPAQGNR